ncbi:pentapeptide repeat-containing protein, partial [Campylobacter jejuni]|nr:pentapeptide repeat-containing protein [Campylobacter jejuni]
MNNLKAEFNSSHFKKEVYFGKEITDKNVEKSNSFGSCSFEYANFSNCHFKKEVYFKNNDFKQVFFRNSKFNNNIHFNNSIFKDYADFHECEFEKTANFYRVRFDKTPNFSQAIFKGNLNAVNTNLNFTFDDLQERIKQEYAFYETQRTAKEAGVIPNLYQEKSLDKFANDFRDSFRIFKNALIKDNNLLDASNFHKYELYCK